MPMTALPTPPSRSDPTTFADRGDALLGALPVFVTEGNALETNVNAKEASATAQAAAAVVSAAAALDSQTASASNASAAATSAGAALWVSGTAYALGAVVWSPATRYTYRRTVARGGVTDPSADGANWALAGTAAPQLVISTLAANALLANQHLVLTNAAASTATLPAAPAAGDVVWVSAGNGRIDNVIARNGQLLMGLAEDITIDSATATVQLRYINAGLGWRLV